MSYCYMHTKLNVIPYYYLISFRCYGVLFRFTDKFLKPCIFILCSLSIKNGFFYYRNLTCENTLPIKEMKAKCNTSIQSLSVISFS